MSLKVYVLVQVGQMDGTEVIHESKLDTVINTNPSDPTAEPILAKQAIGLLSSEVIEAAQERMDEYSQLLARMLGGMG